MSRRADHEADSVGRGDDADGTVAGAAGAGRSPSAADARDGSAGFDLDRYAGRQAGERGSDRGPDLSAGARARWHAGVVAAIAAVALGLGGGVPAFLWLAVVPLGYAVYGYASGVPAPALRVERTVEDERPEPGDRVEVDVRVTNAGDRPLADLRVADGPPAVPRDGPAALATALRPGESETLSYELSVPRGSFEFDDATARVRSLAGGAVASETVAVDGPDRIECGTALDGFPLREETIQYVGRTPTDTGGSGVEFHSAREYRRGDPVRRIDWRRYARTGDLTTVQLREERAMTVVFLLDDRPGAQRSQPGYGPDSLDLSTYAASRAVTALVEGDHRVGVATLSGVRGDRPGEFVDPGAGRGVRRAAAATLDATDDRSRADGTAGVPARLAQQLPARAQVVYCTPLADDLATELADALEPRGHPLTVLSPDMASEAADRLDTDDNAAETTEPDGDDVEASPLARAVATMERERRVADLRGRGVPVVDWDLGDPLALALAETFDRLGTGSPAGGVSRPRPTGETTGTTPERPAGDAPADPTAAARPPRSRPTTDPAPGPAADGGLSAPDRQPPSEQPTPEPDDGGEGS